MPVVTTQLGIGVADCPVQEILAEFVALAPKGRHAHTAAPAAAAAAAPAPTVVITDDGRAADVTD